MSTDEPLIQFLTTARMSEKGRLTLPKRVREDLGLKKDSRVAVLRLGDGLLLFPENKNFEKRCERIRKALAASGAKPIESLATLPEARRRVFKRRYRNEAQTQ